MSLTDIARPSSTTSTRSVEQQHEKDFAELAARLERDGSLPTRSSMQCWSSKLHSPRGRWLPAALLSADSRDR